MVFTSCFLPFSGDKVVDVLEYYSIRELIVILLIFRVAVFLRTNRLFPAVGCYNRLERR